MTTSAGDPARAEAVKSGCSSLVKPTSLIASRANCRFLLALSSRRESRSLMSSNRERSPKWSASSTSAERTRFPKSLLPLIGLLGVAGADHDRCGRRHGLSFSSASYRCRGSNWGSATATIKLGKEGLRAKQIEDRSNDRRHDQPGQSHLGASAPLRIG